MYVGRRNGDGKGWKHTESSSYGYLSACIAELCERGVKEAILLTERLDVGTSVRLGCLESLCIHVRFQSEHGVFMHKNSGILIVWS